MGLYLNPDNKNFYEAINREIYVDKSLLIERLEYLRKKVNKYICVSRPIRFGKSTDADMLVAYYSKECNSHDLFDSLKISNTNIYLNHLNKHNVIYLNIQKFLNETHNVVKMVELLTKLIFRDIKKEYPDIDYLITTDLTQIFEDIYSEIGKRFIFIFL
ncbi:AAA family ATPase [Thomasclavelia sp.]|uniref:AAA family ATPase n=1 Tax=Thomasclavelia sp. TaxID=3025757 RepID=UPI0025F72566|nr:AAA family ATPase [Thomasclavelia sp.]